MVPLKVSAAVGLLVLAACGSDAGGPPVVRMRTVGVAALDTLRFEPDALSVAQGERIRFVVTNAGKMDHEFVLGDEATQLAHERQATAGMQHSDMTSMASLALTAGETKEVTVTFDEPGKIMFGCHVPGHYAGGIVGTVEVAAGS